MIQLLCVWAYSRPGVVSFLFVAEATGGINQPFGQIDKDNHLVV